MANGHVRELHLQGHPRTHQRVSRPQFFSSSIPAFSKAELLGQFLSYAVNVVPNFFFKVCPRWIMSWFHWSPTSTQALEIVEEQVFSNLKRPYSSKHINIGKCCGPEDNYVWTICMNTNADGIPLVLLHGFAGGVGLWLMNLDSLSASRPIYAIDLLGFGQSSRPDFSSDALEAEMQFFISLEKWRTAVGLDKFILLGHSMGGYIAASYALHYPARVALLILVDPWGLPEKPISLMHRYEMDSWVKFLNSFLQGFNYLACVRLAGPFGPYLVKQFRSDLRRKYGTFLRNPRCIMDYVYHCNAQNP
ncbi:1-acylglycerol-3-phosphate O-acyltransferase ABHD5-like, partial [Uloborus diversus]|uniref:1-acylglycerol-3-phosphate O-acyltransferase ABHD5-like n=1 Tax=Uloborus diversus TaxID=327109 RepID=UPI002409A33B